MNKEKVFIEGYEVGFLSGTDGTREKKIQVASGEIVSIDENFIYKTIESQKVVVPQFVAEWIEYFKKYSGSLYGSIAPYSYYGHAITDDFVGDVKKILEWIRNNSETYARAWLDGYEVEKEKRYLVRMKSIREDYETLNCDKISNKWNFSSEKETTLFRTKHTRKELEEAGFGEVFNSPLFEIEEVE